MAKYTDGTHRTVQSDIQRMEWEQRNDGITKKPEPDPAFVATRKLMGERNRNQSNHAARRERGRVTARGKEVLVDGIYSEQRSLKAADLVIEARYGIVVRTGRHPRSKIDPAAPIEVTGPIEALATGKEALNGTTVSIVASPNGAAIPALPVEKSDMPVPAPEIIVTTEANTPPRGGRPGVRQVAQHKR